MSLLTSLATGTTGLASASAELSVVGDNIANANTIGFKAGRAAFEDELAQSVVGGPGQVGLGSRLQAVQRLLTQGSLSNTGLATDLALQGSGFFVVRGTSGDGRTGTYLTRGGQFAVDRDGYLVNLDGLRVQGYGADALGNVTRNLGDLPVGAAASQPQATAGVTLRANLQSDVAIPTLPWDPANPVATSNFSSGATIYDSLGQSHQVQVYFRRTAAGQWDWHALADGGTLTGGTAGTSVEVAGGQVAFDTQGRLTSSTQTVNNFNPLGAVQNQAVTYNFGSLVGAGGGTGLDGLTQFAAPSAATFIGQDGYTSGQLSSLQIDKVGNIVGMFTNGQTRTIGQVSVANVPAPDKLERMGSNMYAVTRESGELVVGSAGEGGRAFIAPGALEQSNVDIAAEFVRMIAAQRAFEASSKTITTADQLLSELIAMKR